MEKTDMSYKTAKGIAVISFFISFIIITILISDYIKTRGYQPLTNPVMISLLKKLDKNPGNETLKTQIRQLDYISRNLFFTNKAQMKNGGMLLLVFLTLFIISAKCAIFFKNNQFNDQFKSQQTSLLNNNKKTEQLLITTSLILTGVSVFFYFSQDLIITLVPDRQATAQKKTIKEQYLSHDDIIGNWLNIRGAYGNGIAYNATPPVQWDGKTGQGIIWKTKIELPGKSSPLVHGSKIFITGATKDKKAIFSYDFTTGKQLWVVNVNDHVKGKPKNKEDLLDTGYAASTMACDGKRLFAVFTTGEIICLSIEGDVIWSKSVDLSDNMYGHASSLMVFENKLYVQLDKKTNSKLLVLNTATGDTIKTIARNDMISWASPVIYHKKGQEPQLIVNANPYTISYNLNSDTENWRTECLTGDVAPSIAYFKDKIYTTNTRDALFCLDASTGKIIWESYDPVLPDTASPVVTKDFLFMATAPGVVSCINTADGSILWEKEFHHLFYSSPILADNKIFVTSRKGKTHIFEAIGEYTPISEPQLFEEVVATPAFIKDKIVMRTKKHLYLIGEK